MQSKSKSINEFYSNEYYLKELKRAKKIYLNKIQKP